ncbi:MAG: ATP-binding protein, partial [Rhodospirillales bacterium]|nr:ATP-binding protein [Rhodospirillales bacterium]
RPFAELWQLPETARAPIEARALFRDQHAAWRHAALGETRNFVVAGRPILDAEGRFAGYRGLGADVTAQLQAAEGALSQARRSAERANRAKSEFLANVSHELRTPLNAIIGFSDAMRSEALGAMRNKRYLQYAADIHDSAQHLLDIVNEILDLSRIEAGNLVLDEKAVVLGEIVEGCLRMMQADVDKAGLTLETNIDPELPRLRADPVKLRQILLNLLSNAVKFTPSGGTVQVLARINPAGNLELEVRDTGIGIKPAELSQALERYGQIKTAGQGKEGIGLGLSITKGLVELHGGTFRLSGAEHGGTRALVELPKERLLADDADGEPWKVLF